MNQEVKINQEELNARIKKELEDNSVMLYMKGDRNLPQCGFSGHVIKLLDATGVEYQTHDVLSDPELRMGMKHFSNWPTFPQLFVKGELVGGCDIINSMNEAGDLAKLFKDKEVLK